MQFVSCGLAWQVVNGRLNISEYLALAHLGVLHTIAPAAPSSLLAGLFPGRPSMRSSTSSMCTLFNSTSDINRVLHNKLRWKVTD